MQNRLKSYDGSAKEKNKQDIKNWVENSLHDPVPRLSYSSTIPKTAFSLRQRVTEPHVISRQEFETQWRSKFVGGYPSVVDEIIGKRTTENTIFPIPELLQLILSLRYLHRYYDIDMIYQTYRDDMNRLKQLCDPCIYSRFVKVVLQAEFRLKNYHICEELFSEYIKYPRIQANMIDIGLVTFVKNQNFPLAKEFYTQVLKNQETFPIMPSGLQAFMFEIYKTSDFLLSKKIFNLWLENTQGSNLLPLKETIALMHRLFLKFNDEEGLEKFLSHEKILRTDYRNSLDFELCILYHELVSDHKVSVDEFEERSAPLIAKLDSKDIDRFYLNALSAAVSRNNFELIKHITAKCREDGRAKLSDEYHKQIAYYFVRNGQLKGLIQYFKDAVLPCPGFHLNQAFVEQLWNCALQNYPILTREITNDLRLILEKNSIVREFCWLRYTLENKLVLTPSDREASTYGNKVYSKAKLHSLNPKCAIAIQRCIKRGDITAAYGILVDQVRHGARPDFNVFYTFLKLFIKNSVHLAKLFDQLLRGAYHKIPLKVDILWLKHNAQQTLESIKSSIFTLHKRQEALLLTRSQIKLFEEDHRNCMNLQNYMQISSLLLDLKDPKSAIQHLYRGRKLVNESNRLDWFIYYSTALKVFTRARNPDSFLKVLSEWNRNNRAWLITPSSIRSCKGYLNYFIKNQGYVNMDDTTLQSIRSELELLTTRYTNYKFQGLNDMKVLSTFLEDWIEKDLIEKNKIDAVRRRKLLSEDEFNND